MSADVKYFLSMQSSNFLIRKVRLDTLRPIPNPELNMGHEESLYV